MVLVNYNNPALIKLWLFILNSQKLKNTVIIKTLQPFLALASIFKTPMQANVVHVNFMRL